jgi:hypothetical protein
LAGSNRFFELDKAPALQARSTMLMCSRTQLFAADLVVLHQAGALEDVAPGLLQVDHMHVGKARLQRLLDVDLGAS